MPIKGLSDRTRLPRLGKIRLGVKKESQSGKEYPSAVDYFVCPPEVLQAYPGTKDPKTGEYDNKPRALDIIFPVNNEEVFFAQWLKRYGKGSGLLCKGDGEKAHAVNTETGEMDEITCDPMECEWFGKKHCRQLASLQFLMPKVPGLGVWQVDTSSYNSIVNLNSNIKFIKSLTGGKIAGLTLRLVVRPQEAQVEGKKKIIHVLDLSAPDAYLGQVLTRAKALDSGFNVEMPEVDESRPDEFYPPGVVSEDDDSDNNVIEVESKAHAEPAVTQTQGNGKVEQPAPKQAVQETSKPVDIDARIKELHDLMKHTSAKRALRARHYPDKQKLLAELEAEYAKATGNAPVPPKPIPLDEPKPTGTNGAQKSLF